MDERFRVRTQIQEFEASTLAQLKLLVRMGIIRGEDQLQVGEEPWRPAREHPELAELFGAPAADADTRERPRHLKATIRREPTPLPGPPPEPEEDDALESPSTRQHTQRGPIHAAHALRASAPLDGACLWVQTEDDTLEVRGLEVLDRLLELGVVQLHHRVSSREDGPFTPLSGHPVLERLKDAASEASESSEAGERADVPERETSNVILLTESEIIYLNDGEEPSEAVRDRSRREVSNVIALSEADLEPVERDDNLEATSIFTRSEELLIILEEDDLIVEDEDTTEFTPPATSPPPPLPDLPAVDSPWEQFSVAMNRVAQAHPAPQSRELTWDVFRSIMERSQPAGSPRGPSERTWQRFRARILNRRRDDPAPSSRPENTWDRFRSTLASPQRSGENTWRRFVTSLQEGPSLDVGRVIAGEAPIRSGIHQPVMETGPSVLISNLNDD